MGYDMSLVNPDETNKAEYEQAQTDFYAACEERKKHGRANYDDPEYKAAQRKVEEAYARMDRLNTSYFRLNISGMSAMRDDMAKLGMLAYDYEVDYEWPSLEDYGLTEYPDEEEDPTEAQQKWIDACKEKRRWSPSEPGLPAHKFGSNDGWIVTPEDCRSALDEYEQARDEKPDLVKKIREEWVIDGENYFDSWIAFLTRAIDHGGFEVW